MKLQGDTFLNCASVQYEDFHGITCSRESLSIILEQRIKPRRASKIRTHLNQNDTLKRRLLSAQFTEFSCIIQILIFTSLILCS